MLVMLGMIGVTMRMRIDVEHQIEQLESDYQALVQKSDTLSAAEAQYESDQFVVAQLLRNTRLPGDIPELGGTHLVSQAIAGGAAFYVPTGKHWLRIVSTASGRPATPGTATDDEQINVIRLVPKAGYVLMIRRTQGEPTELELELTSNSPAFETLREENFWNT